MKAPPSWPYYLPRVTPPNNRLGIRISHLNLEVVHKHSDSDWDSGSIKEAFGKYGLYIGCFAGITFGTESFRITCACSVISNSLWPRGLEPWSLLCSWDFPGKNTIVGYHFYSRGSSQCRDLTPISCIGRRVLYHWATWEALGDFSHQQISNCLSSDPIILNI